MIPETLCFSAAVALLAVVVWVCSKLKGAPIPLIAAENIQAGVPVYCDRTGKFGAAHFVREVRAADWNPLGVAFDHYRYRVALNDLAARRVERFPTPEDPTDEA